MCLLTQLGQEIKRVERNNMRSAKAGGAEGGERGMSRESGWARGAWAFPIFRATKTNAFSTNAQSKFASVIFGGVQGPWRLAAAQMTAPFFLCISEAKHETLTG